MKLFLILLALLFVPTYAHAQSFSFEGMEDYQFFQDRQYMRERRQRSRAQARERRRAAPRRQRSRRRSRYRPPVVVSEPEVVVTKTKLSPGVIYISTKSRKLYYSLEQHKAIMYPIAVGKRGFAWSGVEKVTAIKNWPDWRPPDEMRIRDRSLPKLVKGGPKNPLGAAAIYLGDTLYRVHGTNDPRSIGTNTSSGCIRMHNKHVLHLIKYINIGTEVVVYK